MNIYNTIKLWGLDFDHTDHQELYEAAKKIKNVGGAICEIGLRRGGGMGVIIHGLLDIDGIENRTLLSIDPYGNIPYKFKDGVTNRLDYTNEMKNSTLANIYKLCEKYNIHYYLYEMTDSKFFELFYNGFPIYNEQEVIVNTYALVHLDGPHTTEKVTEEIDFFAPRMEIGGMIIIDDIHGFYNYSQIKDILVKKYNFGLVAEGIRKASYIKI